MAAQPTEALAAPSATQGSASKGMTRRRHSSSGWRRRARWTGWLFAAPALGVYAFFVLRPIVLSVQYSFYKWDGIGTSSWVGLSNYANLVSDPELYAPILHAFELIV